MKSLHSEYLDKVQTEIFTDIVFTTTLNKTTPSSGAFKFCKFYPWPYARRDLHLHPWSNG